jgi:aryl-alcohol dehydrogenase-like predicted oxidoreductase
MNRNIEKRALGKTGELLSVIGFGGIVVMNATPEEALEIVKMAIDAGVNYFDVAPTYGNAEAMLGPALEPYRKDVFLSCKTTQRTKDSSRRELEQSQKNLRTEYFDLYQFHAVTTLFEVETILGKGGALETFVEARNEGKIRFIGFSAHSVEAAMALMNSFDFDSLMFPVNITTWYSGDFGHQVLALAQEKKVGIIALKAMAKGKWPQDADRSKYPKSWYEPHTNREDILNGLSFTLSQPVTCAIPSGEAELFKIALDLRSEIKPLNSNEFELIKSKSLDLDSLFKYPQ